MWLRFLYEIFYKCNITIKNFEIEKKNSKNSSDGGNICQGVKDYENTSSAFLEKLN